VAAAVRLAPAPIQNGPAARLAGTPTPLAGFLARPRARDYLDRTMTRLALQHPALALVAALAVLVAVVPASGACCDHACCPEEAETTLQACVCCGLACCDAEDGATVLVATGLALDAPAARTAAHAPAAPAPRPAPAVDLGSPVPPSVTTTVLRI